MRVHGKSKRRTWRKLHLGVDESSGEIVAAVLSSNNLSDGEVLPMLRSGWRAMRICGRYDAWDAKNGKSKAAITDGRWLRRRCRATSE